MAKTQKKHQQKKNQHKKQPLQKTTREYKPNIFDKIYNNFIEKYPFLIFLGLLIGVATFVFWDFLSLDKLYLFKDIGSDSINIFYPQNSMARELANNGLHYTFRNGLGSPVGVEPDFLSQLLGFFIAPHTFIVTAIVELFTDEAAYFMFFDQLTNILVGAIIFYFYLTQLGLKSITRIAGGLIFGFCGVMILGSVWFIETRLLVYAAFMLLGFELMYKKNIWIVLPIAVFMASRTMGVFWFYPFGLMLGIYALIRYFETNKWNTKNFTQFILKFAGLALIGILLNIESIYGNIISLLNNPRVSGDASISDALMKETSIFENAQFYITAILRIFSSDMVGGGIIEKVVANGQQYLVPNYRGWQNYYEGPILYIGLLSLLLIPSYFFNEVNKKSKIVLGIYMLIFSLPIIFPYFHRAFWAFQGTYFRAFSFVLIFPFFYTALKSLNNIEQIKKINIISIIVSAIIFICLLIYLVIQLLEINPTFYNLSKIPYNLSIRNFSVAIIIIYSILFVILKYKPELKKLTFIVILLLLIIELSFMSNKTINDRMITTTDEFVSKVGYNDYTVDALEYLKSIDSTFYRIEKEYQSGNAIHGSLNDAYVQGYFGTSRYSSSPDARYLNYLQGIELVKKGDALAARWMSGLRSRPLQLTLINGKYILSKNPKSQYAGFGYKKIHEVGDVHIYENTFGLPIGFTYNKYIKKSDFDNLSMLQKDIALMRAVLIEDSLTSKVSELKPYELKDTTANFNLLMYDAFIDTLKNESLQLTKFKEDKFEGKITLSQPQVMYLSILYDKNWIVEIDGKPTEIFTTNLAFTGVKLTKGEHEVKVYYKPVEKRMFNIMDIVVIIFIVGGIMFLGYKTLISKKEKAI